MTSWATAISAFGSSMSSRRARTRETLGRVVRIPLDGPLDSSGRNVEPNIRGLSIRPSWLPSVQPNLTAERTSNPSRRPLMMISALKTTIDHPIRIPTRLSHIAYFVRSSLQMVSPIEFELSHANNQTRDQYRADRGGPSAHESIPASPWRLRRSSLAANFSASTETHFERNGQTSPGACSSSPEVSPL